MKTKRIIALLLAVVAIFSLTACNNNETVKKGTIALEKGEISYPLDVDQTVSWWKPLASQIAGEVNNLGDTPFASYLEEATGINVEYRHPSQGAKGALNLLLAAGDLPDIITGNFTTLFPDDLVEGGDIVNLKPYIKDYAPNYYKQMETYEDFRRDITTDEGNIYGFVPYKNDDRLLSTQGLMIRKDWLDEFGLDVPETAEDWDKVLAAFKTKCEYPITLKGAVHNYFAGLVGCHPGIYVENGVVKYGSIEEENKQFCIKLNEWYNKGYIDKNWLMADQKTVDSNILNGISGVTTGSGGQNLGVYLASAADKNGFNMIGISSPMDKNGLRVHQTASGRTNISSANVVSGDCEYPELAIRLLDYGYSDEGHILWNFGKEGESFNYVDGYPKYADFIFDSSDGKTVPQKMGLHSQALSIGPFLQDVRYLEQYYSTPQQREATEAWAKTDVYDYLWPQAATFTLEESDEYNTIMNAILTYQGEMQQKFIVGAEPIEKYDEMVKKIYDMGLDRALEIRQAAYDRYINR